MMADVTLKNNWVVDNGKVKVTDNKVRCQNIGQKSTIDWVAQVLLDFCGEPPCMVYAR